jgi:hypothetical protein
MSAPLLFRMFKSKTGFPLHAAVRLRREDVVFLYLVENNANVSINDFILFLVLACNKQFSEQYSHVPHNDVSVNVGPHIRQWPHNIII